MDDKNNGKTHAVSAALMKLIYGITDTYGIAALIFITIAKVTIPAFKIYNRRFEVSFLVIIGGTISEIL